MELQRHFGQYDNTYKIIIIGDSYVGKTSLLHRLSNVYEQSTVATLNRDLYNCIAQLKSNRLVKLMVWDTSGQERFMKSLPKQFYRDCHGVVIVYDVTCIQSFVNSSKWLDLVKENCNSNCSFIFVGNKIDSEQRQVSYQNGLDLANCLKLPFIETSAKDNFNVIECFQVMAQTIVDNLQLQISNVSVVENNDELNTTLIIGEKQDDVNGYWKNQKWKANCC